jgi:hypothetical protein
MTQHKPYLLILVFSAILWSMAPVANSGWFGNNEQQERLKETEEKLQDQQQATDNWQGIACVLGIACVITLVVGAAIGSKGRRAAK